MADTITPNAKLTNQTEGGNNNSWGQIADNNFERIDDIFGDVTELSVTGGTTALTETQEFVNAIEVAGTLASNHVIEFSGRGGKWIIKNETAGSFSLTAKVSGQTGVTIAQGDTRIVYSDGTDIKYGLSITASQPVLPGAVMDWAGATAPTGWLLCYGQAISRTTYAALFAAIGIIWGAGDSVSTFNVPDFRGRVRAGKDDMGGSSANRLTAPTDVTGGINGDTLAATGGSETNLLAAINMPNVTISVVDPTHAHPYVSPGSPTGGFQQGGGFNVVVSHASSTTTAASTGITASIDATARGGTQRAVNNLQPTAIVNTIIYTGVTS
jgi:microcystin-dependent protein